MEGKKGYSESLTVGEKFMLFFAGAWIVGFFGLIVLGAIDVFHTVRGWL